MARRRDQQHLYARSGDGLRTTIHLRIHALCGRTTSAVERTTAFLTAEHQRPLTPTARKQSGEGVLAATVARPADGLAVASSPQVVADEAEVRARKVLLDHLNPLGLSLGEIFG